jgi:hypothetical protein
VQRFYLLRVRQHQTKSMAFQNVPNRTPIDARGFHCNLGYLQLLQPSTHPPQFVAERAIHLLQRLAWLAIGGQYADHYRLFMNIHAAAAAILLF